MRTLLTVTQQQAFLSDNYAIETIEHKWSARGYGNSKILDSNDNVISKANGCGYDRFGTVIGLFIECYFQDELNKLGARFCKDGARNSTRKGSKSFYGMFYNTKTKTAHLDGACGSDCMFNILNAIGFELTRVHSKHLTNNGYELYQLKPVSAHNKKYIVKGIK